MNCTDRELLSYILTLYSITLSQDSWMLKKYIFTMSRLVENEVFNKTLRKTMKLLDGELCGKENCNDWLINHLFVLYKGPEAI
jgi:hypothetical protein